MQPSRLVRCSLGAVIVLASSLSFAGTAQWEFDGNLSSSTGQAPLEAAGFPGVAGAPGVAFETAIIGGEEAQVARLSRGTALAVLHGFPANGGGAYVNQYTIILDLMSPGIGDWISLYQTNEAYNDDTSSYDLSDSNDGDWFINPEGGIGISGVYGGALTANTWYRIALVVDLAAGTYTSFIDGAQVQQLVGQGLDGRFALYTPSDPDPYDWFLLFADETAAAAEMGEIVIGSFQFRDAAATAAEIAALGGPTAAGIGSAPPGPVSDACAGAPVVAVGSSVAASTAGALPDNIGGCGANNSPAVWVKVIGTGRDITAELCGSALDTRLSVFSGGCGALVCLGENDDSCGAASRVHWSSAAGTEYLLRIFGFDDPDAGAFTLAVRDAPVPANDLCADAVAIELGAAGVAEVNGTTRGATVDAGAPACGEIRAPGVWYRVAGTGGAMQASTCNASPFDTVLSVFSGGCGALVCAGDNDDTEGCGSGTNSSVRWSSVFGTDYYILVHGFDALPGRYHVGDFALRVSGEARDCISFKSCRADQNAKSVTLEWETVVAGHDGFEISLKDVGTVATVGPDATSFTHSPALSAGRLNVLEYSVTPTGIVFVAPCFDTCRVVLSSGEVCFADDFDAYTGDNDLEFAGWSRVDVVPNPAGRPGESATWTVTNPGNRANPPTFDGSPSSGRFAISDSDRAGGDNGAPGSGNSNDLWSPPFSTLDKEQVWLHMDVSAQMNNNGVVVFDIDVTADDGANWTNVYRRVAPSRTGTPPAVATDNSDGFFGRLDVDLSVAAGLAETRFRLRSFEPSDDWWVAVDNVIVDDVPALQGGSEVLFEEDFSSGLGQMAAVSLVEPPNSGALTWTTEDPCARTLADPPVFPHQDGRGAQRLTPSAPFAILDSDCDPDPAEDEYLVTAPIDATGYAQVYLHYKSEIVATANTVQEVLVSLDGGESFVSAPIFAYNAGGLFDSGEDPFYAERVFEVPEAAGKANVAFAFHYQSGGDEWWWAIDDVKVSGNPSTPPGGRQTPVDCNQDGRRDISDGICVLGFLFNGDPLLLPCGDGLGTHAANLALFDGNGDAKLDLSDAVRIFNFLFSGGPPPVLCVDPDCLECIVIPGCPDGPSCP
jgi:hypothetical protein